MTKERFDIQQHITGQIIAVIERGAGEFRLPGDRSAGDIMRPVNIASRKPYRGVHVLPLWATADDKGYSSGIWGTYRRWAATGAQVRKGEKAAYIVFYVLCGRPHNAKKGSAYTASVNVVLQKKWRTCDKRFCGVQKPAPYATYLRVDDRCPPSSVEDRSCTTNYLSGQPLLLAIERDPMRSLASAS